MAGVSDEFLAATTANIYRFQQMYGLIGHPKGGISILKISKNCPWKTYFNRKMSPGQVTT